MITAGTKAGFTSDTWRGYLSLKSLDSTGIQVQAKTEANGYGSSISVGAPAGTIAMVKALGYRFAATCGGQHGGSQLASRSKPAGARN